MSHPLTSIAFIPDGNRRYAEKARIPLAESYRLGTQKAWQIVGWMAAYPEIKVGTFYTLSLENLVRQKTELSILFSIFERELQKVIDQSVLEEHGCRFKAIGRTDLLPSNLQRLITDAEKKTAHLAKKTVNLALGYNGQAEIVDAAKKLAQDAQQGKINPETIDEKTFSHYLYSDFPAPDLVVRTSGVQRLSAFLTYQSAYSELYFCDKLWPEFEREDLALAVDDYHARERKFGK